MYGQSYNGYGGSRDQYGEAHGRARDQYGQTGSEREPRDQYGHGQSSQSGQYASGGGSSYHRYQDQTRGGGGYEGSEGRKTWTRENGGGGYGQGSEGRRSWTREDGAGGGRWTSANSRSGGGAGASRASWATTTLTPFVKNFLSNSAPFRAVDNSQVEEFRREKEIKIMKGQESCPNPVIEFEAGGFPHYITKEVLKAGFTHPPPIQAQSISIALSGQVRGLTGINYLWLIP